MALFKAGDDPRLLRQFKQATSSDFDAHRVVGVFEHAGQRAVEGQLPIQATGEVLPGLARDVRTAQDHRRHPDQCVVEIRWGDGPPVVHLVGPPSAFG